MYFIEIDITTAFFFTEPMKTIATIAAVTIGLLSVALVIVVASIVAVGQHMHGKCFRQAIDSL